VTLRLALLSLDYTLSQYLWTINRAAAGVVTVTAITLRLLRTHSCGNLSLLLSLSITPFTHLSHHRLHTVTPYHVSGWVLLRFHKRSQKGPPAPSVGNFYRYEPWWSGSGGQGGSADTTRYPGPTYMYFQGHHAELENLQSRHSSYHLALYSTTGDGAILATPQSSTDIIRYPEPGGVLPPHCCGLFSGGIFHRPLFHSFFLLPLAR
jgi:hypothetical protein